MCSISTARIYGKRVAQLCCRKVLASVVAAEHSASVCAMTLTSVDTETPGKSYENLKASFRSTGVVDVVQPQLGLSTRRIFTKKKEMMAYGKHVKLQGELQAPLRFKWLTLF